MRKFKFKFKKLIIKCNFGNLDSFRFAGQNLAVRSTTGSYTLEKVINGSLNSWFNEYTKASVENILKVGSPTNG